jgi:hypothetical protein
MSNGKEDTPLDILIQHLHLGNGWKQMTMSYDKNNFVTDTDMSALFKQEQKRKQEKIA